MPGDSNLYRYVTNQPTGEIDSSGLQDYVLNRDVPKNIKAGNKNLTQDLFISVTFLNIGDTVKIQYTDPNSGKATSESIAIQYVSRTRQTATTRIFDETVPTIVMVKSKTGQEVRTFHVHQDLTDRWMKLVDGTIDDLGAQKDDYSSAGDADNLYYGGWWLYDSPKRRFKTDDKNEFGEAPCQVFWQAHVYVEEVPKVGAYWGWYAQANYSQPGANVSALNLRVLFGPDRTRRKNPFLGNKP